MDLPKVGVTRRGCENAPEGIILLLLLLLLLVVVALLYEISAKFLAPKPPELLSKKPQKLIKDATFFVKASK